MTNQLNATVVRGLNGKISEIRFSHHPGATGIKEVVTKAIKGIDRNSGFTPVDGMIIFSCGKKHIACLADEQALREMHANIVSGNACLMPLKDGFLDGIVVAFS